MEKMKKRIRYIVTVILVLVIQFLLEDLVESRKELEE